MCLSNPNISLLPSGAREKSLTFPGNTLPGVLGAGAFQTLGESGFGLPGKEEYLSSAVEMWV